MTSTIAHSASIGPHVEMEGPVHIAPGCAIHANKIGRYCFINFNCIIFNNVTIGRFVSFARNCQVGAVEHPIHQLTTSFFRTSRAWFPDDPVAQNAPLVPHSAPPERHRGNHVTIGNDVWFGASCLVLKGVDIGDGAVVGLGSVVTKDVPPYAIVAGNPARILRYRFPEPIITRLLRTKWWDKDMNIISMLPFNDIEACLDMLEQPEKLQ